MLNLRTRTYKRDFSKLFFTVECFQILCDYSFLSNKPLYLLTTFVLTLCIYKNFLNIHCLFQSLSGEKFALNCYVLLNLHVVS